MGKHEIKRGISHRSSDAGKFLNIQFEKHRVRTQEYLMV